MTIDSQVSQVIYNITPANLYWFAFEYIGPETVDVYWLDANEAATYIDPSQYSFTTNGVPPIYIGGQILINVSPAPGAIQVLIIRNTPVTQLVDLEPYTPFPAETLEFALDKITLIQQEQGKFGGTTSGGGIPIDANTYIPLSGTKPGFPMTGSLEQQAFGRRFRVGIIGGGWDNYGVFDLANDGLATFSLIMNGKIAVYNSKGEWTVSTVYDASTPPQTLVTKQFVEDYVGGPGAAFVPLSGTVNNEEMTGGITFKNTTNNKEFAIGPAGAIFPDHLVIGKAQDGAAGGVLITSYTGTVAYSWIFDDDGQMLMPDIDYSLASPSAAVPKSYVDAQSGGVNNYIKLTGTDVGYPVTGNITWRDAGSVYEYLMGVSNLPGFTDGFMIAPSGSSPVGSNIYMASDGLVSWQLRGALTYMQRTVIGANTPQATYELTVRGETYLDGALVVNSSLLVGAIVCTGAVTSAAQLTDANAFTRKDYVDGLNTGNVKTTGNQSIGGDKTFTGNMTMGPGCNVANLGSNSSRTPMVSFFGVMGAATFAIPTLLETQDQIDSRINTLVMAQLDAAQQLLVVARERIEALEAQRFADVQRFEAIEARLLAGGL